MTTQAFCPGHITALFYAPPPGTSRERTGSRGAGLSISLGARAKVRAQMGEGFGIVPGPGTRLAPTVATAVGNYISLARRPVELHLDLELDLPVGQGFGMSGAMALAAVLAAEGELGLLRGDATRAAALAHSAEVEFRTGLGDVVAQMRGGLEIRRRPGLPPHGEVVTAPHEGDVLIAWTEEPLHTSSVLGDPEARARLERAALPRLDAAPGAPTLEWLLEEGWAFAQEAGLAGPAVREMVEACLPHGRASQVMLGNSIFAAGDLAAMGREMDRLGRPHRVVRVDNRGARVLGGQGKAHRSRPRPRSLAPPQPSSSRRARRPT
jgi:pantoate kinase